MTQEKGRNMWRCHQQRIKTSVDTVVCILFLFDYCMIVPNVIFSEVCGGGRILLSRAPSCEPANISTVCDKDATELRFSPPP
jgi:hypothetical protein